MGRKKSAKSGLNWSAAKKVANVTPIITKTALLVKIANVQLVQEFDKAQKNDDTEINLSLTAR